MVARLRVWGTTGVVALLVVVACSLVTVDNGVPGWERSIFRAINELPDWLEAPMTGVQYAGVAFVPFVIAAIALVWRKWRLAVAAVLVYPAKLLIEKEILKSIVERGRPGDTEPGAILRDAPAHGPSFPSGHAIVAFALAGIVAPYLPKWGRVAAFVLAVGVCVSRVYLGAHNPLDVVAGSAAGLLFAAIVNLVLAQPVPHDAESATQST